MRWGAKGLENQTPHAPPKQAVPSYLPFPRSVNFWQRCLPSVDEARPARCPRCAHAGCAANGELGLWGHGLRPRLVFGVLVPGATAAIHEVLLRRFLCLHCGAVITVGPAEIGARLLYGLVTVALVLARWGSGVPLPVLRREFAVGQVWGPSGAATWRSVRRWTASAAAGRIWPSVSTMLVGTRRALALRITWLLGGAGPPGEALELRAVAALSSLS